MKRSLTILAGAALLVGLVASPVAALDPTTAGTWIQYPTGATEYQAEVQQPINTTNTSNWSSKSKGAIPVMFKLSSRVGPAAFESIGSDANVLNDYAYLSFTPDNAAMTFSDIYNLSATYVWDLGDCHGGSLRWSVRVDSNGNGVYDPQIALNDGGDAAVFIYYGLLNSLGNDGVSGCGGDQPTGIDQSGLNMIGQPDLRYDITQFGGPFYGSYAQAVVATDSFRVWRASLVLDSGWQYASLGDQRLAPGTTATVDDNSRTFISSAGSAFGATCTLPTATIEVSKNDPVVSGDVNEVAVQSSLADDGNFFRVVDCKYQYILSIPSLQGAGTYEVQIWIDGVRVPTPSSPGGQVKFDIR